MSKKISQFPQITDRNGDDWLLIEEAETGAYRRIKVSDFIAGLSGGSSGGGDPTSPPSSDVVQTNLWAWLEADSFGNTLNNTPINVWNDKSSNSRNAASGDGTQYQTNVFGTLPAIYFPGSTDLEIAQPFAANLPDSCSIFIVFKSLDASRRQGLFSNRFDSGSGYALHCYNNTNEGRYYQTGNGVVTFPLIHTQATLLEFYRAESTIKIVVNGVTVATGSISGLGANNNNLAIGSEGNSEYLKGWIGAFIAYDTELTDENKVKNRNFLKNKYSFTFQ